MPRIGQCVENSCGAEMQAKDAVSQRNLRLFCRAIGADFEAASGRGENGRDRPYELYTDRREWDGRPPAFSILRFGRFGNNIIQIIHAAHLAKMVGATKLYIGEVNVGALAVPRVLSGLTLTPYRGPPDETILKGTFFNCGAFKRQFSEFGAARKLTIVSTVIAPMLRNCWGAPHARTPELVASPYQIR